MSVLPAGQTRSSASNSFEIKSAQLPLIALLLKSEQWETVAASLLAQFGPDGEQPDFFDNDPLVLDFANTARDAQYRDPSGLLAVLKRCRLTGIAFRSAPQHWTEDLLQLGLVMVAEEYIRPKMPSESVAKTTPAVVAEAAPVREPGPIAPMVIDKPLRSGQKVYARGTDLIVLAIVNQGAEVIADGNIHVYAPLRGKAMAGARGNTQARIFAMAMAPELISIAGVYRTSENPLPPEVAAMPAQVRLSTDGQERLLFEPLNT